MRSIKGNITFSEAKSDSIPLEIKGCVTASDIAFEEIQLPIISEYKPEYKTDGAACFDFKASETHTFKKGDLFMLGTGVRCAIPRGWCMLVFARSSLGLTKLIIPNSVGVIDSDYRGEIKVPLFYLGDDEVTIEKGQRIAQGMLIDVTRIGFTQCKCLPETKRGEGGFGSTGE
jgi:dUTP pyrophosphatase